MIKEPKRLCPFCQSWIGVDAEACMHCHRNISTGEEVKIQDNKNVNPAVTKIAVVGIVSLILMSFASVMVQEFSDIIQTEEVDLSNVYTAEIDYNETVEEINNRTPEERYVAIMGVAYCEIVQPLLDDEVRMDLLLNDEQGKIREAQLQENMLRLEDLASQDRFSDVSELMLIKTNSAKRQELDGEVFSLALELCEFDLKEYKQYIKSGLEFFRE